MSLNRANSGTNVLIFNGERILIYCDDVEFSIEVEQGKVPAFKGNKKGRIYLTSHRTIFLPKRAQHSSGGGPALESFSMPFGCMREVDLEQPVFGSNFIKGKTVAEANGGWEGKAKFKLWFNSGGAIEFGQAMLQAAKLSSQNAARMNPPPYVQAPSPAAAAGPPPPVYSQPPPTYYAGPDAHYAWVPYATFPMPPPISDVTMLTAPPPYAGVDPPAYSETVNHHSQYAPPTTAGGNLQYPPPPQGQYPPPPQGQYPPPPQGQYPPPPQGQYPPPPQGQYPAPPQGQYPPPQHDHPLVPSAPAAYYPTENGGPPHTMYAPAPPYQPPAGGAVGTYQPPAQGSNKKND